MCRKFGHNTKKKTQPRPIIAKVSFFKDKEFIKSHIKNIPKVKQYGVADDFPNGVEEIRKTLYPLLKKARQEKKRAFFNIEKLVIDDSITDQKPRNFHYTDVLWQVANSKVKRCYRLY